MNTELTKYLDFMEREMKRLGIDDEKRFMTTDGSIAVVAFVKIMRLLMDQLDERLTTIEGRGVNGTS